MTDKEAFDWFKYNLNNQFKNNLYGGALIECREYDAMKSAVEALERQIPQKPIKLEQKTVHAGAWRCPVCGVKLSGRGIKYCYRCGQKLAPQK